MCNRFPSEFNFPPVLITKNGWSWVTEETNQYLQKIYSNVTQKSITPFYLLIFHVHGFVLDYFVQKSN